MENIIKNLEEAEKIVKEGEHLYLVAVVTRQDEDSKMGSFIMRSNKPHPLWKMYYILQEGVHPVLEVLRDEHGLICVTGITKLT